MRPSCLALLLVGAVLFLAPSFTLAGETAAAMEAMKGEAKAKIEEAQGNKMKAMGERAKGKVKELKAKTE